MAITREKGKDGLAQPVDMQVVKNNGFKVHFEGQAS